MSHCSVYIAISATSAAIGADASETLKAAKESDTSLKTWTDSICNSDVMIEAITSLQKHVIPAPLIVAHLIAAIARTCGVANKDTKDICGDITWEVMRVVSLHDLLFENYFVTMCSC